MLEQASRFSSNRCPWIRQIFVGSPALPRLTGFYGASSDRQAAVRLFTAALTRIGPFLTARPIAAREYIIIRAAIIGHMLGSCDGAHPIRFSDLSSIWLPAFFRAAVNSGRAIGRRRHC